MRHGPRHGHQILRQRSEGQGQTSSGHGYLPHHITSYQIHPYDKHESPHTFDSTMTLHTYGYVYGLQTFIDTKYHQPWLARSLLLTEILNDYSTVLHCLPSASLFTNPIIVSVDRKPGPPYHDLITVSSMTKQQQINISPG